MTRIQFDPNKSYETVSVAGRLYLFYGLRIDRTTIPEGMFMYEVADADGDGCFARIQYGVMVNFWGTIIGMDELPEVPYYPAYGSAEYEGSYGEPMTVDQYRSLSAEERESYKEDTQPSEEYACFPEKSHRMMVYFGQAIPEDIIRDYLSELKIEAVSQKEDCTEITFTVNRPIRLIEIIDAVEYLAEEYETTSSVVVAAG